MAHVNEIVAVGKDGGTLARGREAVEIIRATVVAAGLLLYAKTRMKANRMYSPTAMMVVAEEITGKKFKKRAYKEAGDALKGWAEKRNAELKASNAAEDAIREKLD